MRFPAWAYDAFMWPLEAAFLRGARRRLLSGLHGRTLEIGAGTGANLKASPPDAGPSVATDPSLTFLESARAHRSRAMLVCARAEALPFKSGVFEVVLETLVLCSVADPASALSEAGRVLHRGGELRMLDHVRAPGAILGPLLDAMAPAWLHLTGECHLDRDVEGLVRQAGLRVERRVRMLRGMVEELVVRP